MILLFLVLGVVMLVIGVYLCEDISYDWLGTIMGWVGGAIATLCFCLSVVAVINIVKGRTYDTQIVMYEEENIKIEKQISTLVTNYQEYEQGTFSKVLENVDTDSLVCIVSLYPELKSDTLVSKQLEIYVQNNEQIKKLKKAKISLKAWRWALYFG